MPPLICVVCVALSAPAVEAADLLAKAPSHFAKVDDIRVHYKSLGEGETALVFIHGWTCDLTFWRAQTAESNGLMRMLFIDLPGHGQSDKPKVEYTMDLFARATDAVLQDAGVQSAVLVGHSMGVPVARQFYRRYPKKTLALVAVDGALRPFSTKKEDHDRVIGAYTGPDYKDKIGSAANAMFAKGAPDELRKAAREAMQRAPQHVVVGALKGMLDPAIWKDDEIKVPLLVILAKNPFWSADYEKYVHKLAPQVDYHVLDGVGHFLMLEKPQEFNQLLDQFLKKQGLRKP
jgi:pimeloyl-ACP methyl ester carboxylesterase